MLDSQLAKLKPLTMAICGAVTLVIMSWLWCAERDMRTKVATCAAWPVVVGVVSRHQSYYSPASTLITYDYKVADKKFSAHKVHYDQTQDLIAGFALSAKYKEGESVSVHYNPGAPGDAVLSTEASMGPSNSGGYAKGFFLGSALFLAGLFGVFYRRVV
ncbi:MAG: DUF3592 domain-containing protein [Cyanobacteria bacterium REEB67]|nr:DUF3592 domain-containing protein [Cyanobacteria bacterium REEB67]